MIHKSINVVLLTGFAISGLFFILGCGTPRNYSPTQLTDITYPYDFRYVHRRKVLNTMHTMAFELSKLEQHFEANDPNPSAQIVLDHLTKIETAANKMGGPATNYDKIYQYLPQFAMDIETAKNMVQLNPPSYEKAKDIGAMCYSCHAR